MTEGGRAATGGVVGRLGAVLVMLAVVAARPGAAQGGDDGAQRIARDLVPQVERAVGLTFRRPPVVAVRSREQVRGFLDRKIAAEFPPAELRAVERSYRAFHLISDTLDLRRLMVDLYSEQVAGFYDPDSSTLFVVRGADPVMVRVILAHELVHALQDQYTRLNAILKLRRHNDRQMAGQAVMEGQAMVASFAAMAPGGQTPDLSRAWTLIRDQMRQQQAAMPVFASAPRILQEGLLFPYLAGGEFIQGFESRRADAAEQPYGERLPISTEQILHASKYTARERPVTLSVAAGAGDTLVYADDMGEFDTRIALMTWGAGESEAIAAAAGWNGDRYLVLGSRAGTALVWASAWDTPQDAAEFERALRRLWEPSGRGRTGGADRRWQIDLLDVRGTKIVRLVDAPRGWAGWRRLPAVTVAAAARR